MAHPVDVHVGQRLRQRRRLLGLTQEKLAESVDIRFQQIQKYESGGNRISASRLWELCKAMDVSIDYFFTGLPDAENHLKAAKMNGAFQGAAIDPYVMDSMETAKLLRAYYELPEEARQPVLLMLEAVVDAKLPEGKPAANGRDAPRPGAID